MPNLPTHAVILAAGFGSRLAAKEGHKLLVPLQECSLLQWHLAFFKALGVTQVTIVTGHEHHALEEAIHAATKHDRSLTIRTRYNQDFERSNGISVLTGAHKAPAPFWLTMGDHVFDPALAPHLLDLHPRWLTPHIQGALVVDPKLASIYDMPDATKVWLGPEGELLAIGKEIPSYNVVDVGLFYCDTGFLQALEDERLARGDCSTSDAVKRLSAQGAFAFPQVGAHTWQDVDTPGAHAHARALSTHWPLPRA